MFVAFYIKLGNKDFIKKYLVWLNILQTVCTLSCKLDMSQNVNSKSQSIQSFCIIFNHVHLAVLKKKIPSNIWSNIYFCHCLLSVWHKDIMKNRSWYIISKTKQIKYPIWIFQIREMFPDIFSTMSPSIWSQQWLTFFPSPTLTGLPILIAVVPRWSAPKSP